MCHLYIPTTRDHSIHCILQTCTIKKKSFLRDDSETTVYRIQTKQETGGGAEKPRWDFITLINLRAEIQRRQDRLTSAIPLSTAMHVARNSASFVAPFGGLILVSPLFQLGKPLSPEIHFLFYHEGSDNCPLSHVASFPHFYSLSKEQSCVIFPSYHWKA